MNIPGDSRILLVGHTHIGDLLMDTPAVHCIRKAFPAAKIDILVRLQSREIIERNPDINAILANPTRSWNYPSLCKTADELKKSDYDLTISFNRSQGVALLLKMAGIPKRIGYMNNIGRLLFTRGAHYGLYKHVSYNGLNLLEKGLGIEPDYSIPLQLHTDPSITDSMRCRLEKISQSGNFFAVNPNSTRETKNWPFENFAYVADSMAERGFIPILIGSQNEKTNTEKVRSAMKSEAIDLCGNTSIGELISLISLCRFIVTNDSGPMHIGYALKIPTYSIFGSTDPARCGPWAIKSRVFQSKIDCIKCYRKKCWHMTCMHEIGPEQVLCSINNGQL